MLRHIRNFIGRMRGYSGCLKCGDTWNWKEPHEIKYEEKGQQSSAMFPLCNECFQKLPVGVVMTFCKQLLASWIASGKKIPPGTMNRALAFIRREIEATKESA